MNAGDVQAMTDDDLRAFIRDREAKLAAWRAAEVAAELHDVVAQIKATAAREQQQRQDEEDSRVKAMDIVRRIRADQADAVARRARAAAKRQAKLSATRQQRLAEDDDAQEPDYGAYLPSEDEIAQSCNELRERKAEQGETPLGYERAGNIAEADDANHRSSWLPLGGGRWQKAIHNGNTR